jgi:hypothetical protein
VFLLLLMREATSNDSLVSINSVVSHHHRSVNI